MKITINSSKPLKRAGFQTGDPLIINVGQFDTIESMLENMNEFRAPDNQIKRLFADSQCTITVQTNKWFLFNGNTTFWVSENSF
jgi:hypothetical protein